MEIPRWLRRLVVVTAVTITPILGRIGWNLSPGKEAFLGALGYWPLLLIGTLISTGISIFLYYKRSVPIGAILIPGTLIGTVVLTYFLKLDYRREWVELTTQSGFRGIIYEDSSGEFGLDYVFLVERPNGEVVGEAFLDWHLSPDEAKYIVREIKGQLQVVEVSENSHVIAWYSPASDKVLSYRGD